MLHRVQVIAKAYDNPIPGYKTNTVGNLRLWEALPLHEFDLDAFNKGEYDKVRSLGVQLTHTSTFCVNQAAAGVDCSTPVGLEALKPASTEVHWWPLITIHSVPCTRAHRHRNAWLTA